MVEEEEEVEKEEKEKLHLGLVEKALQRVVGVVEMHSLRSLHPPQVEEEVAEAGLLPAGTRRVMESPPPSLSEHAGHQEQEVEAATTPTHPQP